MFGTHIPVLDLRTWPRGDILGLVLTDEDVGLLRGVDCDILTQGLIGFIEYSYHQGIPSFLKAQLKRALDVRYAANWMYGTHIPVLDIWTWPRGDIPSLVLTDEDVSLLRGGGGLWHPDSRLNRIHRILIPSRYTFFSESPTEKKSRVKRAWPGAISGWVTDCEVFPGAHR
jgi:hypothetical protein